MKGTTVLEVPNYKTAVTVISFLIHSSMSPEDQYRGIVIRTTNLNNMFVYQTC